MEVSFWKKVLFYVIEPGKTLIEPISEEIQLAENNLKFTEEQFFLGYTYSETHLLNLGMYNCAARVIWSWNKKKTA